MKVVLKSYKACIEIASKGWPHIVNEDELVDYLPEELFGKTHEVKETSKEDGKNYFVIEYDICDWWVCEDFVEKVLV